MEDNLFSFYVIKTMTYCYGVPKNRIWAHSLQYAITIKTNTFLFKKKTQLK